MSFQAYLDSIRKRTGKTPHDFFALAKKKGLVGPDLTAGRLVAGSRTPSASATATPWRSGQSSSRKAGSPPRPNVPGLPGLPDPRG